MFSASRRYGIGRGTSAVHGRLCDLRQKERHGALLGTPEIATTDSAGAVFDGRADVDLKRNDRMLKTSGRPGRQFGTRKEGVPGLHERGFSVSRKWLRMITRFAFQPWRKSADWPVTRFEDLDADHKRPGFVFFGPIKGSAAHGRRGP